MEFIKNSHIDFLSKRRTAFIGSGLIILAGLVSLIIKGGPNYGIDFEGGTEIQVRFEKPIEVGQVRSALRVVGFGSSEIKNVGAEGDIMIRVELQGDELAAVQEIEAALTAQIPDNPHESLGSESIGPRFGRELRVAALYAILFSLIAILIYISVRFEFKFAVAAVAALFHDVLITLGVFSFLNLEVSLAVVAAFLTIVGYSLNDTIVVFDRVRENVRALRREAYDAIVNISINQSLSRTVMTSLTTLIVVIVLFVFGGQVIRNFSFALLIGVVVGTYSSIFVASPILVEWTSREAVKKKQRSGAR